MKKSNQVKEIYSDRMQLKDSDNPLVDNFRRSFGYKLCVCVCFFFFRLVSTLENIFRIILKSIEVQSIQFAGKKNKHSNQMREKKRKGKQRRNRTPIYIFKTNFPDTHLLSILITWSYFFSVLQAFSVSSNVFPFCSSSCSRFLLIQKRQIEPVN